ncbi:MAG TPA: ATP-dependent helicase [Gaiellaceae bacterium]|nr:ATP-dependent helicase [Gaiellaceae bacterium]
MSLPAPLLTRLERLTPDQRAAATAPPGPTLCVAPAGSGKTTTLIARICWLISSGVAAPDRVTAVTFNKRAAVELEERLATALGQFLEPAPKVRVRTFHALAREILTDAGHAVEPLADRLEILRRVRPRATAAELGRLDTAISRLKLDLAVTADQVAADPDPGATAQVFVEYERAIAITGGLDFDDLLVRGLARLEAASDLLARWRERCSHLLVDEAQDLDRSQLRLALLLAAPANRIFLVGDDDQSIYGWRLADVRRLLSLAETSLPSLQRVDLVTNFRCPAPVIDRAVRLVEHNQERFAKTILARDDATGSLLLARSNADDVERIGAVIRSWPDDGGTRAVLARTNRELLPAAVAALQLDLPFTAPDLVLPVENPIVDEILTEAARGSGPPVVTVASVRRTDWEGRQLRQALLAWAAPHRRLEDLRAAVSETRERLARLRRDDAQLVLATAHGTKGLEFDHVAVVGLDAGRFPSARTVSESAEPERALEEERRLAYVAWTRARRTLTLVFDPGAPSEFLLEAFSPHELGVTGQPAS